MNFITEISLVPTPLLAPQIRRLSHRHCALYKFTYLLRPEVSDGKPLDTVLQSLQAVDCCYTVRMPANSISSIEALLTWDDAGWCRRWLPWRWSCHLWSSETRKSSTTRMRSANWRPLTTSNWLTPTTTVRLLVTLLDHIVRSMYVTV